MAAAGRHACSRLPVEAHFSCVLFPARGAATDTIRVNPYWVFSRAGIRLEIRRETVEDGLLLVIDNSTDQPRSYLFPDLESLEPFQNDMERLLLATGWTFEEFGPDRRSGLDRRMWPRIHNDRRRWWTDSGRALRTRASRS